MFQSSSCYRSYGRKIKLSIPLDNYYSIADNPFMLQTNRNPHVTLEMPRQQVVDRAYREVVRWFVIGVYVAMASAALTIAVKPVDQSWSEWLKPFWRTPSVHVLTSAEIQQKIDANNPIVKAVSK